MSSKLVGINQSGKNYVHLRYLYDISSSSSSNLSSNTTNDPSNCICVYSDSTGNTIRNSPLTINDGVLDMVQNNIVNVTDPVNASDVATKNYVDNANLFHQTIVVLNPSQMSSLNSYPGVTLVSAPPFSSVIATSLEFHVPFNRAPYTTNGAKLYVNWLGNYVTGSDTNDWVIPTDTGLIPLLTSTRDVHAMVFNTAQYVDFPEAQDLILMSTGAITGGDSEVLIRVTYQILPSFED